ncbi:MAG TPA: malto-oligosyltrehalose synthase [Puia sp.]|nr:malto-oligosyltrehalose synthase [Puia sp.]
MFIPSSTYRVQLNESFTLRDLSAIVSYLHALGITTVYASPISTATKGSRHGYDVTDALVINPEIGSEQELAAIVDLLHNRNMSWLQDIVPNHMAYDPANPWLSDVLERGPDSIYYDFFDIMTDESGDPGGIQGQGGSGEPLLAPFLGSDPSECLKKGELTLQFTGRGFVIRYYDKEYPVAARLYRWIVSPEEGLPQKWIPALMLLEKALTTDPTIWLAAKNSWLRETRTDGDLHALIERRVAYINERPSLLGFLLQNQSYSLANARLAASRINYRRFFTINGLICLSMEKQQVFDAWHQTLRRWYEAGWINGLRVDHIDGLADPKGYLRRLRALFGEECYVVAEKILTGRETVPDDWPLEGTTGYDFLAAASQVLTNEKGSRQLLDYYRMNILDLNDYKKVTYERKLNFLCKHMGGELNHLFSLFARIPSASRPVDERRLKEALAVWMASFPVYRAYPDAQGLSSSDRAILADSLTRAGQRRPELQPELDQLAATCDYDDTDPGRRRLQFLSRLMQFTGPLAAKGIEDTTFYVYNPYIDHCEVGDSPAAGGIPPEEFHRRMLERQKRWPLSMNGTTTHDTKRGEDARIRLSFLTCIPGEWTSAVSRWRMLNRNHVALVEGRPAPSPNDEYMIYQSLLGGFPEDGVITDAFRERFAGWLLKALREAKTETDYDEPDEGYEGQCQRFASALLQQESAFFPSFSAFARDVIRRSSVYSLSQLLLKLTAPGIPDIYQGAELWELSFVDPDNRRPVDFALRSALLGEIRTAEAESLDALSGLLARHKEAGIEKLFTLYRALHCRNALPSLFAHGEYIPVSCNGAALAFLRHLDKDWALVCVPLLPEQDGPADPVSMVLPFDTPRRWTDAFTRAAVSTQPGTPCRPEGLSAWPVVLLTASTGAD